MTTTTILIAKDEFKHFKKAWRHLRFTDIHMEICKIDRHYMTPYCEVTIETNHAGLLFVLGKMAQRIKQTSETSF